MYNIHHSHPHMILRQPHFVQNIHLLHNRFHLRQLHRCLDMVCLENEPQKICSLEIIMNTYFCILVYSWNFFLTLPPYLEFYSIDHRKIKIVKINQKKLKFLTYTIIPCNILFYFVQRNRSKNQRKDKNVYTVHFNDSV